MTNIKHLNDFLPQGKVISCFESGSEVIYAMHVIRYAKQLAGVEVSLAGISVKPELLEGMEFSYAYTNGVEFDTEVVEVDKTKLYDYSRNLGVLFKGDVSDVSFTKDTEEELIYNFDSNHNKNYILHREDRSQGYVALLAYLVVRSKLEGKQVPKIVIDHERYNQVEFEYSDILIIKNYGNKLFKELLYIRYPNDWDYQPEWESFFKFNLQQGYMSRLYTSTEKGKKLVEEYKVGDVVLYYTKGKVPESKSITNIISCYPAVITSIEKNMLKLVYYPIVQTERTRTVVLHEVMEDYEGDEALAYSMEDFTKFTATTVTHTLENIGIAEFSYKEENFILKPMDSDGTQQYFKTEDGMELIHLDTLDTIYAVFEDRGVDYDKELYLAQYFEGRTPVYEQYRELENKSKEQRNQVSTEQFEEEEDEFEGDGSDFIN